MEQSVFTQIDPKAIPAVQWCSTSDSTEMDCETALMLRLCLKPIFETAQSWRELLDSLSVRDYALHLRYGRLMVINQQRHAAICTGSFLGVPFRVLVERLGRPGVIIDKGDDTIARLVAA